MAQCKKNLRLRMVLLIAVLYAGLSISSLNQLLYSSQHEVASLPTNVSIASNFNSNRTDCLRVLVGIFTKENETERRKNWSILLRLHHNVGSGNHPLHLTCGLNFMFVAQDDTETFQYAEYGAFVARISTDNNVQSSMDIGWFRYAVANYPGADFFAKMESDTAIHRRRLENEFVKALKTGADYIGRPACYDDTKCPYYVSGGFYALSKHLAVLTIQAQEKHGLLYPQEEARNTGELIERAGLERGCCQGHNAYGKVSTTSTGSCAFTCQTLIVGDESDRHLIQRNVTLLESLSIHYSPQISFKANQGDDASKRFLNDVPQLVWGFWFGPPMQGNRLEAYHKLKATIGQEHHLITIEDLHTFNLTFSPMHPLVGKRVLSAIHLGDYLRAYFMHNFGGGYLDIKPARSSWAEQFKFFDDPRVWMVGYRETSFAATGCEQSNVLSCKYRNMTNRFRSKIIDYDPPDRCCNEMVRSNFKQLGGNGAYIMRPGTAMTALWLDLVEQHMNAKMARALKNPAPHARCCQPEDDNYPFRWAELHGEALQPAQAEYSSHVQLGLPFQVGGSYRGGDGEDRPQATSILNT